MQPDLGFWKGETVVWPGARHTPCVCVVVPICFAAHRRIKSHGRRPVLSATPRPRFGARDSLRPLVQPASAFRSYKIRVSTACFVLVTKVYIECLNTL
jgi:hypothetical protein